MDNIDKIERRIKALLTQAADQDGTPEGAAFQARAFDLMARYGVEASQLNTDEGAEMVARTITLAGSYTPQQSQLAGVLAQALHCHALARGTMRKMDEATIYGRARHVDRVVMLFSILNPQMAAGADKQPPTYGVSRAVQKRSWMLGFIIGVGERLTTAEKEATTAGGQALALTDDRQAAKNFAYQQAGPARTPTSRARHSRESVTAGRTAADNTDMGQDRINNRPALTA